MRWKTIPAVCAAALLSTAAGATTIARMSLGRLTEAARVVVRARCVSNTSRWEGGEIWTMSRFRTLETLKGSPGTSFTVRMIGGQLGGIESIVAGVPRFFAGEEVVLFLSPVAGGGYGVTAWVEGTFRVGRGRGGHPIVTEQTPAQEIYDRRTRRFRTEDVRRMPLATFRRKIKEIVRRNAAPKGKR